VYFELRATGSATVTCPNESLYHPHAFNYLFSFELKELSQYDTIDKFDFSGDKGWQQKNGV
jgi:hypothetical protein